MTLYLKGSEQTFSKSGVMELKTKWKERNKLTNLREIMQKKEKSSVYFLDQSTHTLIFHSSLMLDHKYIPYWNSENTIFSNWKLKHSYRTVLSIKLK